MDWQKLFGVIAQLAVFSVFISSIIEVIKGVSAVGFWGIIKGLWRALWGNIPLQGDAFPVLNFAIALLCCWAFNVTIMSSLFSGWLAIGAQADPLQAAFARWIDYFGTASVTYLGSDQLFKRFLDAERQAKAAMSEVQS